MSANKGMTCPHCGELIAEKVIYKYTCGKAGRAKSKAKAEAAKRNIRKRWDDVRKKRQEEDEQ